MDDNIPLAIVKSCPAQAGVAGVDPAAPIPLVTQERTDASLAQEVAEVGFEKSKLGNLDTQVERQAGGPLGVGEGGGAVVEH